LYIYRSHPAWNEYESSRSDKHVGGGRQW